MSCKPVIHGTDGGDEVEDAQISGRIEKRTLVKERKASRTEERGWRMTENWKMENGEWRTGKRSSE